MGCVLACVRRLSSRLFSESEGQSCAYVHRTSACAAWCSCCARCWFSVSLLECGCCARPHVGGRALGGLCGLWCEQTHVAATRCVLCLACLRPNHLHGCALRRCMLRGMGRGCIGLTAGWDPRERERNMTGSKLHRARQQCNSTGLSAPCAACLHSDLLYHLVELRW